MKTYRVNIDMKWSEEKLIKAKTAGEAKRKAWAAFKRRCPKRNFEILADRED